MAEMISRNVRCFLDMIAFSEGTKFIGSKGGYDVIVGSTPSRPILMRDFSDHPRVYIKWLNSTAAGRYQLLMPYFDAYKASLGLKDFSPASQDAIAIRQIKEQGAFMDVAEGRIEAAIGKCRNIWASFPGAGYGQHEVAPGRLLAEYRSAGGFVA